MSPSGPVTRGHKVITLGGIGGDAHSVGLIILGRILLRAGFQVRHLGTQNCLEDICASAVTSDAVLVSNMDGHAKHYLRDLPMLRANAGMGHAVWYLGGNPSVTRDEDSIAALRGLGFDRVFTGYVESDVVLSLLDTDLGVASPVSGCQAAPDPAPAWDAGPRHAAPPRVVTARTGLTPWPLDAEREEVLAQWHTGAAAADLAANARILASRASLTAAQAAARGAGGILLHPRCGVAEPAHQAQVFAAMRDAGADVLSLQIDSLTRNNAYRDVELALKRPGGDADVPPVLNGYPAVNHGVGALRALTAEFRDVPMQVRHSTRDPRLLAEISFAGGISAFEGGAITYNIPYYRDYRPAESVARWRYVDALAGTYHRRFGIVIDREFFGTLTASLVPPCLAVAVNVLEALLAAQEGVKAVTLGYAEQGHRAQDVAAIIALAALGRSYLDAFGFGDVAVHTVFHQYMGAFPPGIATSLELLRGSAVTAARSGATRIMTKTFTEAVTIPSAEENAVSLAWIRTAMREGAHGLDTATIPGALPGDVDAERDLVVAEATCVIDAMLAAGRGNVADAVVAGIGKGLLDVPFSPSRWNAGVAMSIRDCSGAVRFADPGSVPLPPDAADLHHRLVAERVRLAGRSVEEIVEDDLLRVARGDFVTWPSENWGPDL